MMINRHSKFLLRFSLLVRRGCACLLLALTGATASLAQVPAPVNVSFADVLAMPSVPPTARISYGDDVLQFGDLWVPAESSRSMPAPLVVMVHGGCWLNSFDVDHTRPLASALAQAGIAVWSLEYRRTGDKGGGWPGSLNDIRAALTRLESLSPYPVDLDNVVVAGHSAGGHLALLAASTFPTLTAVIGLAAITDLIAYAAGDNSCQRAVPEFMGGRYQETPEDYQLANPAMQILPANTLLLHGDSDTIVPVEQSQLQQTQRVIVTGAGHFDWIHPGTAAFAVLLQQLRQQFSVERQP